MPSALALTRQNTPWPNASTGRISPSAGNDELPPEGTTLTTLDAEMVCHTFLPISLLSSQDPGPTASRILARLFQAFTSAASQSTALPPPCYR